MEGIKNETRTTEIIPTVTTSIAVDTTTSQGIFPQNSKQNIEKIVILIKFLTLTFLKYEMKNSHREIVACCNF